MKTGAESAMHVRRRLLWRRWKPKVFSGSLYTTEISKWCKLAFMFFPPRETVHNHHITALSQHVFNLYNKQEI